MKCVTRRLPGIVIIDRHWQTAAAPTARADPHLNVSGYASDKPVNFTPSLSDILDRNLKREIRRWPGNGERRFADLKD